MKKLILTFTAVMAALFTFAQQKIQDADFEKYTLHIDNVVNDLFAKKQYQNAADTITDWFKKYDELSWDMQVKIHHYTLALYYNKGCAYSRLGKIDEGVYWFERSVKAGFADYAGVLTDNDMDNLRGDKRFQADVTNLREKYDYPYVLQHSGNYNNKKADLPAFTYQASNTPELVSLRSKYNLDSIAGNGDEISKM